MVTRSLIIVFIFFLASCSSRQLETHKKQESVSELKQNDITTLENEKIKSDILRVSENWNLNLKPDDPDKPMQLIYGNDTLTSTNVNISLSKHKKTEKDQSVTNKKTEKSDQSKSEIDKDSSEKGKKSKRESPSWGINIGFIFGFIGLICIIYLFIKS